MKNIKILRWIARIWSYLVVAFILLFVGGHILSSGLGTFTAGTAIAFAFFPVGMIGGLIVAWWKEGLGGVISTGSIILFHATMFIFYGKPDFLLMIDLAAIPGPLFIICWVLSSNKEKKNKLR